MATISNINQNISATRASFSPNVQSLLNKVKTSKYSLPLKPKSLVNRSIAKIDIALNKTIGAVQSNAIDTLKLANLLHLSDIQFDLSIIGELNDALNYLGNEHQKLPHNHEAKTIRQDMIEVATLLDVNVNILLNKIENSL